MENAPLEDVFPTKDGDFPFAMLVYQRVEGCLEDHPMTCKWLVTMVIVSSLRIGLWDPFQMAFLWLINGGDPNHLLTWDDPPSISYKVGP